MVAATLRAGIGWLRDTRQVRRVLVLVGHVKCPAALLASIDVLGVEWLPERDPGDEATAVVDFLGIDWKEGEARVEVRSAPGSKKRGPIERLIFEVSHETAAIGRGWLERTVREQLAAESTQPVDVT
jgi:hypothetical protein